MVNTNTKTFHKVLNDNFADYRLMKLFGLQEQGCSETLNKNLELCSTFVKDLSNNLSELLNDKVSNATGGIVAYILLQYAEETLKVSDELGDFLLEKYKMNAEFVTVIKREGL